MDYTLFKEHEVCFVGRKAAGNAGSLSERTECTRKPGAVSRQPVEKERNQMNIKKIGKQTICLLSAGVLAVSLSACGDAAADQDSVSETERAAEQVSTVAAESGAGQVGTSGAEQTGTSVTENPASEGDSHILIAYFTAAENSGVDAVSSASYSMINGEAVGRVQAVANMIQEYTGGDLFSIQTSVVYPADGGELIDYAATEQEEDARPELTTHIENLDQYDTIFVGYPNWWADLPMAMYSFFDEYDFSGKTIVPFNVHNGSRFSRTIQTIEELEPDASVIENGFTVSEQTVADADSDVAAWLEEIGY